MKPHLFSVLLFLGSVSLTIAQQPENLVGTWYGKIPAYRFKQDGTAQCFSKNKVADFTRLLVIDTDLNYTYEEFNTSDTIKYKGQVSVVIDTIQFNEQQFFLFALTDDQLIYSLLRIEATETKTNDDDQLFERIEVNAAYSRGNHQLLKHLYSFLIKEKPTSKDSVYLNSYEVFITGDGRVDMSRFKEVSANSKYNAAVRKSLAGLPFSFIPYKINGRYARGRFTFSITY